MTEVTFSESATSIGDVLSTRLPCKKSGLPYTRTFLTNIKRVTVRNVAISLVRLERR